jgi:hypothetical protein
MGVAMIKTTKAQRIAILRVANRWGRDYRDLRRIAQGTIGYDGAIALPMGVIWLLIERDGYCHS